MTRFAVLTDTHANLPALVAALSAIRELGCLAIYHTGDAVGGGPFPGETLDRLLHTPNMHLIMGNHDELCGCGIPEPVPDWMDEILMANARWTRAQIAPDLYDAITAWPYVITAAVAGHRFAFLHYPRDPDGDGFAPIVEHPGVAELDELFAGERADVIFYGHHHPTADHRGQARYINPGALGCGPDAVARFVVVDVDRAGTMTIKHHAAPYDRSGLHAALAQRGVPGHAFLRQTFFP